MAEGTTFSGPQPQSLTEANNLDRGTRKEKIIRKFTSVSSGSFAYYFDFFEMPQTNITFFARTVTPKVYSGHSRRGGNNKNKHAFLTARYVYKFTISVRNYYGSGGELLALPLKSAKACASPHYVI